MVNSILSIGFISVVIICHIGLLVIDTIHTLMLRDIYSKVCDIVVDADELSQDLNGYYNNLHYLGSQIREDIIALMNSYDLFTQDAIKILASGSVPDPSTSDSVCALDPAAGMDTYVDFTQEAYQISVADKGSDLE